MEINGAIVFGENAIDSTSYDLEYPFITPFYEDIDTTENGHIYFRISNSPVDLERITATIKRSTTTKEDFSPSWCMVVTWHNVAENSLNVYIVSVFETKGNKKKGSKIP